MSAFRGIGNLFVTALLRSPLHRVLSGGVFLITVHGRKSGRAYSTPVQYVERDGDLWVCSRKGRTWWRNFRGGAPVQVRHRGKNRTGFADAFVEEEEKRPRLGVFGGTILASASTRPDAVLIRIHLDP